MKVRRSLSSTGALKPERFKDGDAAYNIGGAVVATSAMTPGVSPRSARFVIDDGERGNVARDSLSSL